MEGQTLQRLPSSTQSGKPDSACNEDEETKLLCVSWNQNFECFAAGTKKGLRVYQCDPLEETFRRDMQGGGFGIVEMLFRTNITALVGGSTNSRYPSNKVMFWDDRQNRFIGELSFKSEVRSVKLRNDIAVVVLECKIYIYKFVNLAPLHCIETLANPYGLCCLSYHKDTSVLVCPSIRKGEVRVEHLGSKLTKYIRAHDSELSCLTLSLDGLLLATASTRGTLIRIFSTIDGTRLQEVRRGIDRAEIYSITLSQNNQWLGVSSDKGTVHVFRLDVRLSGFVSDDEVGQDAADAQMNKSSPTESNAPSNISSNAKSSLSFIRGRFLPTGVLPKYFSSEWSFAQFRLPEGTRHIAAFGAQNMLMIIGMDGNFYRCSFDPERGGAMLQKEHVKFLETKCRRLKTV